MEQKSASSIDAMTALIRALPRPYVVIYSWTILGMMWFNEISIPPLLAGVASAITLEYFGERAVKGWREVKQAGR